MVQNPLHGVERYSSKLLLRPFTIAMNPLHGVERLDGLHDFFGTVEDVKESITWS